MKTIQSSIEPLEALLKSGQLSISVPHSLEGVIEQLKAKNATKKDPPATAQKASDSVAAPANNNQEVLDRLDQLDHRITDMNDRLRRIELSVGGGKSD